MENVLSYIPAALAVLLMFGASIFVHELGHFWVALRRKMQVDAFAIGLGPKIWGRVHNGIEYSIRWIPASGFVRLPQMYTSETLEGGGPSSGTPIPPAPPGSKILVALAGPVMNLIFAFIVATMTGDSGTRIFRPLKSASVAIGLLCVAITRMPGVSA